MNPAFRNKVIIYLNIFFQTVMLILSQLTLVEILFTSNMPAFTLIKAYLFALAGLFLIVKSTINGFFLMLLGIVGIIMIALYYPFVLLQTGGLGDFAKAVFALTPWALLTLAFIFYQKSPHFVIAGLIMLRLRPIVTRLLIQVRDVLTEQQAYFLVLQISHFGTQRDAEELTHITATDTFQEKIWDKAVRVARKAGNDAIADIWQQCRTRGESH